MSVSSKLPEWTPSYGSNRIHRSNFNIKKLYSDVLSTKRQTIDWLMNRGLLTKNPTCDLCGKIMKLEVYKTNNDGYRRRCRGYSGKKHIRTKSVRNNSWFEGSRLNLGELVELTYYWSQDLPQRYITHELGISPRTVVDWANFKREVCQQVVMMTQQPIGGPGIDVEIDESKFGKRKYNRGRWKEGQWVLGGRETNDKGKVFMVCVDKRDAETLLPPIDRWVLKGSIIHTDKWKAYDKLSEMGYEHRIVNHTVEFVNSETGACTNHIENTWLHAKKSMPPYGTKHHFLNGYLAEHMWRQRTKAEDKDPFIAILHDIANVYNNSQSKVPNPTSK